jgi:rhombotail lipoprotein
MRLLLISFGLAMTACAGLLGSSARDGVSSSLVDYLYLDGEKPPSQSGRMSQLQLPLRIGIAFIPARTGTTQGLSEAERMKMLVDVKAVFSGRDFIEEIAVIPEAFMPAERGFSALEKVSRLYELDVMALVSYDQVTIPAEGSSSLNYWTIVGVHALTGSKNDVQTFVETAVFDVTMRKLLFRAPGFSSAKDGMAQAAADMKANLERELGLLQERIRADASVRAGRSKS